MAGLNELVCYLDEYLASADYQDYAPNGLQVEGRPELRRIVAGVTASQALLDAAVERQADAVLVHHGYFWKGEDTRIVGIKQRRLKTLLKNDISLLAYHLPLDGHPELGNNAQLAKLWGWEVSGRFGQGPEGGLAMHSELPEAMSLAELGEHISKVLDRPAQCIDGGGHAIRRVGWCSGAAQGYLDQAAELGLDAFISGEISESTVHIARERGIHYIAAGHHATERYGVQALAAHISQHFDINAEFVDISNPV